jgi:hypothetical protein
MNGKTVRRLCYPGLTVLLVSMCCEGIEVGAWLPVGTQFTIQSLIADSGQYQPVHGAEEFYQTGQPTVLSPLMASGGISPYTLILTPVVDGGYEIGAPPCVTGVRLSIGLHGQRNPIGRYFASWTELRSEIVRAGLLRSDVLASAEFSVLSGIQWVSPSPVPVKEEQIRLLQLRV